MSLDYGLCGVCGGCSNNLYRMPANMYKLYIITKQSNNRNRPFNKKDRKILMIQP